LASVPFGFVLVRVRVRVVKLNKHLDEMMLVFIISILSQACLCSCMWNICIQL
jgi:hypothetical protein